VPFGEGNLKSGVSFMRTSVEAVKVTYEIIDEVAKATD
jgi:hypothetical protein